MGIEISSLVGTGRMIDFGYLIFYFFLEVWLYSWIIRNVRECWPSCLCEENVVTGSLNVEFSRCKQEKG